MPTPGHHDQTAPPQAVADLIHRATSPDFQAWQQRIVRLRGCTNPIHLVGAAHTVDATSGEILHTHTSHDTPLLIPCGNRRSAVCPTCSELYRGDTLQLIRAGLVGGKHTPTSVTTHPRVFATFTAPGFGPVHTRRQRDGTQLRCRPRRTGGTCPHGRPLACNERHQPGDPRFGEPLCPACYDYRGAVLWQAHAGQLWHRLAMQIRRELARLGGIPRSRLAKILRLSYAKVAEYQRRGLIHFHAVLRLDGPDGPTTQPPPWATLHTLETAIRHAAAKVHVTAPRAGEAGRYDFRFGKQLDIRPIDAFAPGEAITSAAVAGYIAKYATKGAESTGALHHRIRSLAHLELLPMRDHVRTMVATSWELGGLKQYENLGLRRWAHMLGFRGHFSTKSRRYSTTLGALRQARTDHRAEQLRQALGIADRPTLIVGRWRYAGHGYSPAAALIAAGVRDPGGEEPL
jgi:hypothetical protein